MDSRFDHLEPNSPEEAQLLAGLLQEAQDWRDLLGDPEAGDRCASSVPDPGVSRRVGKGRILGPRRVEIRRLEGGISAPSEWPVALPEVRRSTDPEIIRADLGAVSQNEREVKRLKH